MIFSNHLVSYKTVLSNNIEYFFFFSKGPTTQNWEYIFYFVKYKNVCAAAVFSTKVRERIPITPQPTSAAHKPALPIYKHQSTNEPKELKQLNIIGDPVLPQWNGTEQRQCLVSTRQRHKVIERGEREANSGLSLEWTGQVERSAGKMRVASGVSAGERDWPRGSVQRPLHWLLVPRAVIGRNS